MRAIIASDSQCWLDAMEERIVSRRHDSVEMCCDVENQNDTKNNYIVFMRTNALPEHCYANHIDELYLSEIFEEDKSRNNNIVSENKQIPDFDKYDVGENIIEKVIRYYESKREYRI